MSDNHSTVLQLPVEITHRQAQAVLQQLTQALAAQTTPQACVVDAAALVQFDSSAIAVLLELKRQANQQQKSWQIHNPPQALQTLSSLYGMQELLNLAEQP